MIASTRIIHETTSNPGQQPETQIDTDELDPPVFEDIVARLEQSLQIAPSDTDIAVAVPASCVLFIESDEPVLMRLQAGETQMRIRRFYADAEDETGTAMPARTMLFSGNTATTANVRVISLSKVTSS